jgi:hypothetical protein
VSHEHRGGPAVAAFAVALWAATFALRASADWSADKLPLRRDRLWRVEHLPQQIELHETTLR